MTDAPAGVAEMARVAKSGGMIAAAIWDYVGEMTMLRAFWDAAVAMDPGSAEKDEGRIMRYCSPVELEALWRSTGLTDVRTGELRPRGSYADFDDYWSPFVAGVAPSGAYAASLDPRRQKALRQEVHKRLGAPSGSFELACRASFVIGSSE